MDNQRPNFPPPPNVANPRPIFLGAPHQFFMHPRPYGLPLQFIDVPPSPPPGLPITPPPSPSPPNSPPLNLSISISRALQEASFAQRHVPFITLGWVGETRVRIKFDPSAPHNFVTHSIASLSATTIYTLTPPFAYTSQCLTGEPALITMDCAIDLSVENFIVDLNRNNFSDLVHCMIAPLSDVDVILGRPWQYDRDILYSGRRNTVSFWIGDQHITLYPLPPESSPIDED